MEIGQCYECRHWKGDKGKAMEMLKDYPMYMDLKKGWADSGRCETSYRWAEIEVHGDASTTLELPANFGCVYFDKDKPLQKQMADSPTVAGMFGVNGRYRDGGLD